jgi:negative regulator of flagellin synthesis FlgM
MVVPINSPATGRVRLVETHADAATAAAPAGTATAARTAPAQAGSDRVSLSDPGILQMGETLAAKGPPVDFESVAKIKKAIEEGKYPIDAGMITESLFAGLDDMLH